MNEGSVGQTMLNVRFETVDQLHQGYMSFIENGGIFIKTTEDYKVGDEVFMLVTLPDDTERHPVAGKIVWITPRAAVGNRVPGIGVQFSDQDKGRTRNKIEGMLEGIIDSDVPTFTM